MYNKLYLAVAGLWAEVAVALVGYWNVDPMLVGIGTAAVAAVGVFLGVNVPKPSELPPPPPPPRFPDPGDHIF